VISPQKNLLAGMLTNRMTNKHFIHLVTQGGIIFSHQPIPMKNGRFARRTKRKTAILLSTEARLWNRSGFGWYL